MPEAIPKNLFKVEGRSVRIELTQGQIAWVDLEDWPKVSPYRWYAHKTRCGFYATTGGGGRGRIFQRMHCLILGRNKVDHRDGDGLNNRRTNLRPASVSQQLQNTAKRSAECTSTYKGVYAHRDGKWCVQVNHRHVGLFDDEVEAAKAYDEKAKELFGEFARLNFPEVK